MHIILPLFIGTCKALTYNYTSHCLATSRLRTAAYYHGLELTTTDNYIQRKSISVTTHFDYVAICQRDAFACSADYRVHLMRRWCDRTHELRACLTTANYTLSTGIKSSKNAPSHKNLWN